MHQSYEASTGSNRDWDRVSAAKSASNHEKFMGALVHACYSSLFKTRNHLAEFSGALFTSQDVFVVVFSGDGLRVFRR